MRFTKKRIAALEMFAMYVFEEDLTVIPKESGWFAEVNATSGEVVPLRERTLYKEDWLGLKALDETDGLVFRNASGKHMALTDKVLREAFGEFFGPEHEGKTIDLVETHNLEFAIQPADGGQRTFNCHSVQAQAWWDSMWPWEQWRWNWNHVTKPWLRGELTPEGEESWSHLYL